MHLNPIRSSASHGGDAPGAAVSEAARVFHYHPADLHVEILVWRWNYHTRAVLAVGLEIQEMMFRSESVG